MHCQVPGIEYTLGKRAVQTMLEGATAIALSYSGVLYIAETDEKKIHRIRQVIFKIHRCIFVLTVFTLLYSQYIPFCVLPVLIWTIRAKEIACSKSPRSDINSEEGTSVKWCLIRQVMLNALFVYFLSKRTGWFFSHRIYLNVIPQGIDRWRDYPYSWSTIRLWLQGSTPQPLQVPQSAMFSSISYHNLDYLL